MRHITGLIGRDELIEKIAREARKGRNLLLTGRPGIGKSTVLEAVLDLLLDAQRRQVAHHAGEHWRPLLDYLSGKRKQLPEG